MRRNHGAIRERPAQLIRSLAYYEKRFRIAEKYEVESAMYLRMRELYNGSKVLPNPSLFVVLCTLCFCSIYRENLKGHMTSPYRARSSSLPHICSPERVRRIKAMHAYMASNDLTLTCEDFETALQKTQPGDLVYLDPPYRKDKNVSYAGFGVNDSDRVERVFRQLVGKGCLVFLSEHDTPFIRDRYKEFVIVQIPVHRFARQKGGEKDQFELLIMAKCA